MKKARTNLNYDNTPLADDEELILYFKNEADAANLKNPDSIVSFITGSTRVTAVLTAFKKGFEAETARKQFYSYIDDLNGRFHCARCISLEELKKAHDPEKGSDVLNPEYKIVMLENATKIIERLASEAPQLMAALIFRREGLRGKDFEKAMCISHGHSVRILDMLSHVLSVMIHEGYDAIDLNVRASKHDQYYKQIIIVHMDELLDELIEMSCSLT